ncbi:Uu.00g043910.m01.CDS01 [Anthostomella pinea]|uniref:Uu.00g043910.m01.CDS01 n=1 Tax=Anthostomella pinea TaxID=933095 RepID=A0AAI8VAZ3_9PEZI|nr:Uu.00g043910.m01.CDS01 [Anthostomella pinea]
MRPQGLDVTGFEVGGLREVVAVEAVEVVVRKVHLLTAAISRISGFQRLHQLRPPRLQSAGPQLQALPEVEDEKAPEIRRGGVLQMDKAQQSVYREPLAVI